MAGWLHGAVDKIRHFAYKVPDSSHWQRPKVGLALGGGFARGIAHIGILRVFEQNGIPIDYLAGTSAGALLGAAYAAGCPLEEMERQGISTRFRDFAQWSISWQGLASVRRLAMFLQKLTPVRDFKDLKIPLTIVATDLISGKSVYMTEGEVAPALCASCAYPGLFQPVERDAYLLVDGFLTEPVPAQAARRMGAGFVIAVNLGTVTPSHVPRNLIEVVGRSFGIIQNHTDQRWRAAADLVIEPDVKSFLWDDFARTPQLVAAGEAAARAALPAIKAALTPTLPQPQFRSRRGLGQAEIT